MSITGKISDIAFLILLTRKLREDELYTDNFPLPTSDKERKDLIFQLFEDYFRLVFSNNEITVTDNKYNISFSGDFATKFLFLEKGLYQHHYNSPQLATYLRDFSNNISSLLVRDNEGWNFSIHKTYIVARSITSSMSLLEGFSKLRSLIGIFEETYQEHEARINEFIARSEERKARLRAIQEQITNRDKRPLPFLKSSAELSQESAVGVLPLEQEVRVIKIPAPGNSFSWYVYPPAPASLPDKAILVVETDVIKTIINHEHKNLYVTSSSYVCEYDDEIWRMGILSVPTNRLYYEPETGIFNIIDDYGKEIYFNNYTAAQDFVAVSQLPINLEDILIKGTIETIKA